jgi:hypothetical protein
VTCDLSAYEADNGLRGTVEALRHLASPHLQYLTLTLDADMASDDALNDHAWSELSLLIETSPNFKRLHMLTSMFFHPGPIISGARERTEQIFPLYLTRGVYFARRLASPHYSIHSCIVLETLMCILYSGYAHNYTMPGP